jgi:hypothetical protein
VSRSFLELRRWMWSSKYSGAPVAVQLACDNELRERGALLITEGFYMWDWPQ